ncbi:helix-turn-helix domain-containing protein [Rhodobacteraceae bacterium F11138]|nr:helix-turn-helix domain-containing protein [Rhodobacteraceae bacterium F11138]
MHRTGLKIGDLARAAETKVVTIRYYEKIGLLPVPGRSAANYRTYDAAALERLRFIRRCRGLGFTLDQIRELLELSSDVARPCAEVDEITANHLADVERKIEDLQALARELRRISASCNGGGTISNCRILDAIAPG